MFSACALKNLRYNNPTVKALPTEPSSTDQAELEADIVASEARLRQVKERC